jgi:peptidyl-prolyl cis-trans isomerase A (cyclophilin A)
MQELVRYSHAMLNPLFSTLSRYALGLGLGLLLNACGGGGSSFPPVVTGFKVQTLQYGRTATFYIGGNDLRSTMTVETSSACANPAFASTSTTTQLVLNCGITAVGVIPLTLKAANGDVAYQTTVSVPKPQVQLTTSLGKITLELDPSAAQSTVNNFLNYVNTGYYTNTLFHRVMPGFVVQAGGFTAGMVEKPGKTGPIVLQSNNGLSNLRGTVAMARLSNPVDSATSEFFINLVDNTFLNYKSDIDAERGYTVFGTVLQGMDVADNMAKQPTGSFNLYANVPLTDVIITAAQQIQ